VPENSPSLPDFTRWPSFPFEGDIRVKKLAPPVEIEPPRSGEDAGDCVACSTPDDAYIWVSERWRVRGMDRPTGLPVVLILECRSHLDIGDLPNLLAAELGVMTVRLERAIRSLDGVARVHVNRWGDGSAHLHMWFLARPYGRLQLRGTFLSLWDDILPVIPEEQWRENLALVAAWLGEFGGRAIAEPAHIHWQSPSTFSTEPWAGTDSTSTAGSWRPADLADADLSHPADAEVAEVDAETRDRAGTTAAADSGADAAGLADSGGPAAHQQADGDTASRATTSAGSEGESGAGVAAVSEDAEGTRAGGSDSGTSHLNRSPSNDVAEDDTIGLATGETDGDGEGRGSAGIDAAADDVNNETGSNEAAGNEATGRAVGGSAGDRVASGTVADHAAPVAPRTKP
jgi:hypothetical protein